MSILITIGLVILGIIAVVLLSLGLAVVFGILVVGAIVLAGLYFLFGDGSITTMLTGQHHSTKVPQEFNQCLLSDDLDRCRKDFTEWKPEQMELIRQLAKQVKEDMGARLEDTTQSSSYEQNSVNGDTTITIDQETDFAKKKAVHEHYVLVSDPEGDKMKIRDLNWDYGDTNAPLKP